MLGKLIKYEFKATYKLMTLIFILMITVSALFALSQKPWRIDEYAVNMFFGSAEILMIILFVVMNVVILSSMFFYSIVRFRKNVLGNEGYLTHTLPVSKSSVIMSGDCINGMVTFIVTCSDCFIYNDGFSAKCGWNC